MSKWFPNTVRFEGPSSRNPFAFKHYDADAVVAGKAMRDHLRFAACYWHTMRGSGADPFGAGTMRTPWDDGSDSVENAQQRVGVFFEFLGACGIEKFCFHDRDLSPECATLAESEAALDRVVTTVRAEMERTGAKLLWGTANLFSHPRYAHGAATSCDPRVFAHAAAQVRRAMEVTHELGGEGYVFWGGREGYQTLLNTDMRREREHLARFLHMAVGHKRAIGFTGQLYIEPKPCEPTKHQYDSDAESCLNFLREFDLLGDLKLNLEANHATLAGHELMHELIVARDAGALGSIDANRGDTLLGWDTDQFPTDLYLTTQVMLVLLSMGGFTTGGLNFDAKRRRESFDAEDLIHAHAGAMDAFARGLKIAAAIIDDGRLADFVRTRYRGWDEGLGGAIERGEHSFTSLDAIAKSQGAIELESGRQERLENLLNEYI